VTAGERYEYERLTREHQDCWHRSGERCEAMIPGWCRVGFLLRLVAKLDAQLGRRAERRRAQP
jgi:hypothetical protein